MRTIIAVIFLIIYFILALPVMGIEWIISRFNKRAADISQLRMVQWGFRGIMFIAGTKVEVHGQENVPKDEAVLYVANHRGFFDVVTTYSLVPDLTGYISKDNIKKVPVLGMIMKRVYCLFIDRSDIKQGLQVILEAVEYVKKGISIYIFPEGTRNKDTQHPENLQTFHDASFKIAQRSKCRIVPVAITGADEVFENHFPWLHKATVRITYGTPFYMTDLEKTDQKKIGTYCRNLISDMIKEQLNLS